LKTAGGTVKGDVTVEGQFSALGNILLGDQPSDTITINGLISDVKLYADKDR
jgi:hypothetical protein